MNKQQLNKTYYQLNKERIKAHRKARYQTQKSNSQLNHYYQANSIKVLLSLKEYTTLNKEKHKRWLNFIWTFQDLNQTGFDIIQIMRIREEADLLINDYWQTAKKEIQKGKNWNSLTEAQQRRLIKHWAREKTSKESQLSHNLEQQEIDSQAYLKAIELAKFHEERGKIKCPCYACQAQQELRNEVKQKLKKELNQAAIALDHWWGATEKEECPECGKVKKLDEESGLCFSCLKNYE